MPGGPQVGRSPLPVGGDRDRLSFWVLPEHPMAGHATIVHFDNVSLAASRCFEAIHFQSDLITKSKVANVIWRNLRLWELELMH